MGLARTRLIDFEIEPLLPCKDDLAQKLEKPKPQPRKEVETLKEWGLMTNVITIERGEQMALAT